MTATAEPMIPAGVAERLAASAGELTLVVQTEAQHAHGALPSHQWQCDRCGQNGGDIGQVRPAKEAAELVAQRLKPRR